MENWLQLVERLMTIQLTDELDSFTWHLTTSAIFSVQFFYAEYMNDQLIIIGFEKKYLW
jgi:hypothetical protein